MEEYCNYMVILLNYALNNYYYGSNTYQRRGGGGGGGVRLRKIFQD
jgi:hypothetical protein